MQTKIETYALTVAVIACEIMVLAGIVDLDSVAVDGAKPTYARLTYSFFHASFLHTAANLWVLWSFVRTYKTQRWEMAVAWLIAVTIPPIVMPKPTVGLSAFLFALFGITAYKVVRKSIYLAFLAVVAAVGFALPNTAATVHAYCLAAGLVVAVLNTPYER